MTAPISSAEFEAALAKLGAPCRVIVAVSGGPDSMALARLAAATGDVGDVLALTVDHGLRDGSREEAERAGQWCRAAGLHHCIVEWHGEKPTSGVQAAARNARYRLLCEAAGEGSYQAILTGHTADDQAETVFMRLARGAGPRGLAAMDERSMIAAGAGEPVALMRPLLEFPRERILATLESLNQPFVEDPSNDDPAFERIRTRALLAALAEQDLLTRDALCRTAARARAVVRRLEVADKEAFNSARGKFHAEGWVSLDNWEGLPTSLIARLLYSVSGGEYPSGEEEVAAALETVAKGGAATLGGAMMKRHHGRLCFFREPAALLGRAGVAPMAPVEIAVGERVLWDRRFIVSNEGGQGGGDPTIGVSPLGAWSDDFEAMSDGKPDLPKEALQTWPWGKLEGEPVSGSAGAYFNMSVRSLVEERFSGGLVRFP